MKCIETASLVSLASCSAGHWMKAAVLSSHCWFYFDYERLLISFPYLSYLAIVGLGKKKLPDLCMRVLSSRQFAIKVNNSSDKKPMTITETECLNIKYMCLFLSHLIHY